MACIATPADLGTVKGGTSSSQSATLLMPPALLFNKVEHNNDDVAAWAAVQSRLHMRSMAANLAGVPDVRE